jgi:cytidylate kinase
MNKTRSSLPPVITIDGPGGTGKGTISQMLAKRLGWHFLDSGALYRVLALAAMKKEIDLKDAKALASLGKKLDVEFVSEIGQSPRIILNREDVTHEIRSELCGEVASQISAFPAVRQALLDRQRDFRCPPGLVTDGRDMGTIVFRDATLKFFLEASRAERAKRRYKQLKQRGINVSLHDVLQDLEQRDERDRTRVVAPLKPASGAVVIDTTHLGVEQVFERVMEVVLGCKDVRI